MRKKIVIFLLPILLLLAVIVYGIWARFHLYSEIPFPGDNMDEYSNTWVGLSLIRLGVPVGNSGLPGYYAYDYRYINADRVFTTGENTAQVISYPWLDHPPLTSLLTGGYSYLKGARNFEDVALAIARRPMVFFACFSLILLAVFSYLLFGPMVSLIATAAYAFSPYVIISSRLIQGENGYLPLMLATLIFLCLYEKRKKFGWLIAAAVLAGMATLFKLSAVSIIITGVILLLRQSQERKTVRAALTFFLVASSITFLYFIYGLAQDPRLLLAITSFNAQRAYGIGASAIFKLITQSLITGRGLEDGWKLAGMISMFALVARARIDKALAYIVVPFFVHLAVYLLFGSLPYGWYTYPFWPFAFVALGYVVYLGIRYSRYLLVNLAILFIPLGVNIESVVSPSTFKEFAPLWRGGIFLIFLLGLILRFFPQNKWSKNFSRGLLLVIFLTTLYFSYLRFGGITISNWYSIH